MRLLGAVLAGGIGRRFGGDKALAEINGVPLIGRVIAALAAETADVVVCGRDWFGHVALADRPAPGLGPMAGLAAALHHAAAQGYDAVLSAPCDTPFLPSGLAALLAGEGGACLATLPLIGRWPARLAPALDGELADPASRRSLRSWAAQAGVRAIEGVAVGNVNTPDDLARLRRSPRHG